MLVSALKNQLKVTFVLTLIALCLTSCSHKVLETNGSSAKPNVVIILVDDLGYADIKAYNPNSFYDTPNIDKLAKEGIQFTNGYAANPVCSPSRFALITGKHPTRANTTEWFHPHNKPSRQGKFRAAKFDQVLAHEELTIAEAFKQNGYQTAFLGKWHLGESEDTWPEHHGFDVNVGGIKNGHPPGGYFSPYKNPRLSDGPDGEYLTERLTDEAISLVDTFAKSDSPFFMLMSFYTVHTPLQAPKKSVENYQKKGLKQNKRAHYADEEQIWPTDEKRQVRIVQNHPTYAAMVNQMDWHVGRLLAQLEKAGVADNTIVVFTSDNGGLSTAEGSPTSNLPLRGGKGWLYEGGIRVPYIIKLPKASTNGKHIDEPVVSTDLFPTLLAAAGLPQQKQQHIDGVDIFASTIKSTSQNQLMEREIYFHYPHYSNQGGFPGAAIRQGNWKLIERFEDGQVHLYNLSSDIGETNDLAKTHPEKTNELRNKLHRWYETTEARFLRPLNGNEPWSPQAALKNQG